MCPTIWKWRFQPCGRGCKKGLTFLEIGTPRKVLWHDFQKGFETQLSHYPIVPFSPTLDLFPHNLISLTILQLLESPKLTSSQIAKPV